MTTNTDPAAIQQKETIRTLDDLLTDFAISEWVDTPSYVTELPETTPDSNIREMTEQEYRNSTTPTKWNRYLTLGRYVTDGFTFDASIDEMSTDPLKVHCMIWYQYTYHLDHQLNIPMKLLEWATRCSHLYLTTNASASALNLNTKTATWEQFSRTQSLTNSWSEVPAKSKKKDKKKLKKSTPANATPENRSQPATIIEETSETSNSSSTKNTAHNEDQQTNRDNSVASDGKMSVLSPTLNVPVSDGTYRATFRMTVSAEQMSKYRNTATIKEEIYTFLNEAFNDDHGSLYNWSHSGTDQLNSISKMTPEQVRQFISPSISIMPSLSLVVVPIRFGFVDQPSKWRNTEHTKEILKKFKATVSFSNSTTTSGKLLVAGYILLKAPMTTHRLRYLQSLRKMLPEHTPPFDILLHKRTPTHQLMPHLVVQCGESHVHSLSESLATILTGTQSALYIPRFVFERMSDAEASKLFESHDSFVKSLTWLPLFPLLSNLDRVRKEHNKDGTVTERTTREWARNIKTLDGSSYAQCDVVNGGDDKLCYLLFQPKDKEAAHQALEAYRRSLYPFTQREAQFRAEVGPPPVIHLSKRVIANLEFIKNLASPGPKQVDDSSEAQSVNKETSESTSSSVSSVSQATRPPTPGESLRKRYRDVDKEYEESQATVNSSTSTTDSSQVTDNSSTSTTDSTATENTKHITGRLSVSSAKFREFDSILLRQKQEAEQAATKASERISTIERQLHRFNDLEKKLSDVQQDISCRFNLFEDRLLDTMKEHIGQSGSTMSVMETRMTQLMSVVEALITQKPPPQKTEEATTESVTNELACLDQHGEPSHSSRSDSAASDGTGLRSSEESRSSGSSLGMDSMDAESTGAIQSPEHKRQRSNAKAKPLHASLRRNLDNQTFSQIQQPKPHAQNLSESSTPDPSSVPTSPTTPTKTVNIEDELLTPRSPTPPPDTNTDHESQYTEKTLPPKDSEHLLTTGNISHRRGSRG